MGFNRPTWLPGRERNPVAPSRDTRVAELRRQRARRASDSAAARALQGTLISLAAILGTEVKDQAGDSVGRLRDVVVHWTRGVAYPTVTAIVVRTGRREALIGIRWVELTAPASVRLRSTKVYARALERHPADVALAHDVLDRQLVDTAGMQVVRPADVYLAAVDGRIDLVGIEVGGQALLRRLGPKRLRTRVRPARVIDWATIRAFSPARADGIQSRGRRSDLAGQAGIGLELDTPAADVHQLRGSEINAALQSPQGETGAGSP